MDNKTMIQYFEWYLPNDQLHWKRCMAQAKNLQQEGITAVWLPPAYKGSQGAQEVGYAVYDTYDLGEFDQKGRIPTKYGTKEEYLLAVKALSNQGLEVLADVVLNHRIGADAFEQVQAMEKAVTDRNCEVTGEKTITAWTKFEFPGRGGKYSDFKWNRTHFDGVDWDDAAKKGGIYQFKDKNWDAQTDSENGNYDYLMGADLDMNNQEVKEELITWGKWYLDTVKPDGFRLDAVKHINITFFREWLDEMRRYAGKPLFTVGEYWSGELGKLLHYLDECQSCMSLFDVPLHFNFYNASISNGGFDMRGLLNNSLVGVRPQQAVTFVDNHDTQPGQALGYWVRDWFKPIAYAVILLKESGYPMIFYGDYYGIPHNRVLSVPGLKLLVKVRQLFAYGAQHDYFDDFNVVGFTREGDGEHPDSGIAVLLSDGAGGRKRMYVGPQYAGQVYYDAMVNCTNTVTVAADGTGEFEVSGGAVSVWVRRNAYEVLRTVVE